MLEKLFDKLDKVLLRLVLIMLVILLANLLVGFLKQDKISRFQDFSQNSYIVDDKGEKWY